MKKTTKYKKTINTRQKGLRIQRKAKTLGERNGYMVHTIHHSRFSKDIFGVADQIWVKYKEVIFVQVKSNQFRSVEKYKNFAETTGQKVLILCWIDNKGWKSQSFGYKNTSMTL